MGQLQSSEPAGPQSLSETPLTAGPYSTWEAI